MARLESPDNYESLKPKISSAAIVGHTTRETAKIWVRAYKAGAWHLVLSPDRLDDEVLGLPGDSLSGAVESAPGLRYGGKHDFTTETDLTHCFGVEGLTPDTRYYYYLISDDSDLERRVELGSNHDYWFRTMPEEEGELVFGFYSCHDPFSVKPTHEGAWEKFHEVLRDRNAHFVIGGGDQVYCDTNDKSRIQDVWAWLKNNKNVLIEKYSDNEGQLDEAGLVAYFTKLYRTYYRVYWQFENLRSVYRRFPQYMIWDDHEIMDGWGSLSREEREEKLAHFFQDDQPEKNYQLVMLMFRAACKVYHEYQHSHNPDTVVDPADPENSVWDYPVEQGAYGFYMLDLRGHHDCENDAGKRLLGEQQLARFDEWINSTAVRSRSALFICSPVPVVHWNESFVNTADFGSQKDDFMDEWGHETNWEERNWLLDRLLKRSHESGMPIVILSGDVHCASAFRITDRKRFPNARLYNVTSSAISRKPAPGLATAAMQKSAGIEGYSEGARFEQLYRFSGANNFALVTADLRDGQLSLRANLYWTNPGEDDVTHKVVWLG